MKKVLIICYNFSPTGGTGALRTVKFCKYLPSMHWEPIVLHINNSNILKYFSKKYSFSFNTKTYCSFNSNLLVKIGLFLDRFFGSFRYLFLPDVFMGSILPLIFKAIYVDKIERCDLVYVSSPPYSLTVAGVFIKKILHKPLVVDLRDPWTDNPYNPYPLKILKILDEKCESFVFHNADKIILNTNEMKTQYIGKYEEYITEKMHVITNGFDYADLPQFNEIKRSNNKFVITYTGAIYKTRNPEVFFSSIQKFISDKSGLVDIEVHFFGTNKKYIDQLAIMYNLTAYVFCHDRIQNTDVYVELVKSDLLLVVESTPLVIPIKVLEYLSSNKPILAIVPEGEAATIIRKYSSNSVTSTNETEITRAIDNYYSKWKMGNYPENNVSEEFMKKYNRVYLTQQLSNVFIQLL